MFEAVRRFGSFLSISGSKTCADRVLICSTVQHKKINGCTSGARGRGGGTHLLLVLSHLTIDQASLLRRSTVRTPSRDTHNSCYVFSIPGILHRNVLVILPPSCFAACGHLLPGEGGGYLVSMMIVLAVVATMTMTSCSRNARSVELVSVLPEVCAKSNSETSSSCVLPAPAPPSSARWGRCYSF